MIAIGSHRPDPQIRRSAFAWLGSNQFLGGLGPRVDNPIVNERSVGGLGCR